MTDNNQAAILRRMMDRPSGEGAETPLTLSRAVRLAFTKSANDTIGLIVTVTKMDKEVMALDPLLDRLDEGLLLIGLERGGDLTGLMAMDMQLRAAILEMQTIGQLSPAVAEDRPPTGTDKVMCEQLLNRFLDAMPEALAGSELNGWTENALLAAQVKSSRAAGLVLDDCEYQVMRLTIDLGVADRVGHLITALPLLVEPLTSDLPPAEVADWHTQFQAQVSEAEGELEAWLHRFDMPLVQARSLQVGQLVPLLGCTVSSVQMTTNDGQHVAHAKLGQFGGKRAVRIETAPPPQMLELGGQASAAPVDMMAGMGMDAANELAFDSGSVALDDPDMLEIGGDAMGLDLNHGGFGIDLPDEDQMAAPEPEVAPDLMNAGDGDGLDLDEGFGMAPMDMDALSLED